MKSIEKHDGNDQTDGSSSSDEDAVQKTKDYNEKEENVSQRSMISTEEAEDAKETDKEVKDRKASQLTEEYDNKTLLNPQLMQLYAW